MFDIGGGQNMAVLVIVVVVAVVVTTGAALVYGTFDMPHYGDPQAPIHQHVAPEYLADRVPHMNRDPAKVDVPNVITAVLASYRGYDTLGETVVIFTAGIGVLLLMRRPPDRKVDP